MDELKKVNNEVMATLELLDEPFRISSSPDFIGRVNQIPNIVTLQDKGAMRYKIYALAAVLIITVINVFAVARTVSHVKSSEVAAASIMVADFEHSRLGVFWPIE